MAKSKRYPRKIPPNTGSFRPSDIIFFDTETSPVVISNEITEQVLRLYVFKHIRYKDNGDYEIIQATNSKNPMDFILYLNNLSTVLDSVYVCSHNLVFDFTILGLLEYLYTNGYNLQQFHTKQLASQFRYEKDICTYTFFDTVSLFPNRLNKIGKILKLEKLVIDLNTSDENSLFIYCNRDVDILVDMFRYWYKFLNDNDFGDFKTTLASTAFSIYRHKYMKIPIDIHCNNGVNKLERQSYKGGRVELFYKGYPGKGEYYKLDVNSMYPYVMRDNLFPVKFNDYYINPSVKYLENRLKRYLCIAHVNITTNDNAVCTKIGGRNIYPIGTFDCYLTTPELIYIKQNGVINQVYELATYSGDYIFTEFVNGMYKIRRKAYEEDNQVFYLISKLIMNSLYGKFGQLNTEFSYFGENTENKYLREYGYDATSKRHFTLTTINHSCYIELYGGESAFSFPAIASHVTAYARLYLYHFISKVKDKDIFYCDTDSLIVNSNGYQQLTPYLDDIELGKLKLEKTSNRIILRAPKDYKFGDEKKLKGISKNATKLKGSRYAQLKWQRFAGIFMNDSPTKYYQHRLVKQLKRVVYSGKIGDDGWLKSWYLPDELDLALTQIKQL